MRFLSDMMSDKNRKYFDRAAALAPLAALFIWAAPVQAAPKADAAPAKDQVERGRYLAHAVAQCVQCHSPRAAGGELVEGRSFTGAPLPSTGPDWAGVWAVRTPNLREMARAEPQNIMAVLTTGKRLDGTRPRSPMPPYRLKKEDAEAVVAYLAALPASGETLPADAADMPRAASTTAEK